MLGIVLYPDLKNGMSAKEVNRAEHCRVESVPPTATKAGQTELRYPRMFMLIVLLESTWSILFISQMGETEA